MHRFLVTLLAFLAFALTSIAPAHAVTLVPDADAALAIDGEPVAGEVALRTDVDVDGPSVIAFDDGRGQATVIVRDDRLALRVRHADAPSRTGFTTLEYWPGGPDWVVDARFEPHPEGRTIPIANIIGSLDDTPNPGALVFEHDGRTHRLEVLDDGSDDLFLVFADRTSGQGSYGAGRYIYVPRPDADGRVAIDFNHAYNPPCAFTDFATCPLPPKQNQLPRRRSCSPNTVEHLPIRASSMRSFSTALRSSARYRFRAQP